MVAVDFSKQEELDADSRAIQQIDFYKMLEVCTILEKLKETILEFFFQKIAKHNKKQKEKA